MTLKHTFAACAAIAVITVGAAAARADEAADKAYREIEATYGFVPSFMKMYPEKGVAGVWMLTKAMETQDGALDAKTKSLINIAVAAQIPCRYCVWLDTKMAKDMGATDDEIAEAVVQAGLTRHWSAFLNGMQVDFDTFKAEFEATPAN
jgi:AhpD family alkylhydroperoxidase